jgi:hypothetical protein
MAMGGFNRAGFDGDDRFGRRVSRLDRDDRFRHFHHFRNRFVFNGFDNFAFFGVPFAYDYPRKGTVAGAGMAGSGLTSAMATIMASSNYS